mgnify:CR=1 FL=1
MCEHRSTKSVILPKDEECNVCFENLSRKITVVLPCTHTCCLECLSKMKRPIICHICRRDVSDLLPKEPLTQLSTPRVSRPSLEQFILPRTIRTALHVPTPSVRAPATLERSISLTPRNESAMLEFRVSDLGSSMALASVHTRPIQSSDMLHARVTRNSVFVRESP